uniref:c-type cytochrome n=1 Tax=Inhella gelatinilytica TaxID=2795030 RepID=UPI0035BF3AF1
MDIGKREFEAKCASCHGVTGKGNGPVAGLLTKSATDLTLLAKRNGGVLPIARMYEVIEGGAIAAHGTRDMPVWGRELRLQAGEYYGEVPYDPEAYVRARILTLIDYVNRIQVK